MLSSSRFVNSRPLADDPFLGWTLDSTKQYIQNKPLVAGDLMVVVNRQGGLLEYVLSRVINPALGKQKRILLDTAAAYGGTTFYSSGKNCFSPKGQSRMIPPDDRVLALISEPGQTLSII